VARRSGFSANTLSVLASLEADTTFWRHAYLIAKETGLRRVGRRRVAEEGV
jgi:hypothetical protein